MRDPARADPLYRVTDRVRDAEQLARNSFERLESVFGAADMRTLELRVTLARARVERCDPLAAEATLDELDLDVQGNASLAALSCNGGELWLERGFASRAREKFAAVARPSSAEIRAVDGALARAR